MTQTTGKKTLGIANEHQYIELLQSFSPRPITSEDDLIKTQNIIDHLIDQGELTPDEQDYLNVLASLVRDYEELNYPMLKQDSVELLKALLDESNLQPQDLQAIFKNALNVFDILNRNTELTISQVKKLANFFRISPEAFLG